MLQRLVRPALVKRLCHIHSKPIFNKNIDVIEERLRKHEEQLRKQEEQLRKQEEQLRKQEERLNREEETLEEIAIHLYGGTCVMSVITIIISMNK